MFGQNEQLMCCHGEVDTSCQFDRRASNKVSTYVLGKYWIPRLIVDINLTAVRGEG